jgi:non-haem Fe2+, alpha-ketoglutarate-dependent halogenase
MSDAQVNLEGLSERHLEQYRRYGVTFPIRVMPAERAAHYRSRCDELEILLGGSPRTIEVRQMHLHFRWAYELCVQPAVLDAVEAVLGPNLMVWATELFAKRARDPNLFIAWHRDSPYMGFDPRLTATAWISLGRSFRENGCLQVVLEEDRLNSTLGKDAAARRESTGPGVPEDSVTNVELEPGQMSMHDVNVYHGSGPNLSGEKRVGFAVRYITPEARALSGKPRVVLARGHDAGGNFEIVAPPEDTDASTALAGLRESAMRHLDAMLYNLKQLRS